MAEVMKLPLSYCPCPLSFVGSTPSEREQFYHPRDPIRQIEKASIRAFMEKHRDVLTGRVLDFGSGKEPYRDLVTGEYVPHEIDSVTDESFYGFDVVMCNQVLQYVDLPEDTLERFWHLLRPGGKLILTYPTNWTECETVDLWRFTKCGMEAMLHGAQFKILSHELRAEVLVGGYSFALGYGVVASK